MQYFFADVQSYGTIRGQLNLMEPIEKMFTFLKEKIPEIDREIEEPIRNLMNKFELVPKHEYEAHMDILKSLENQVAELENRVKVIEDKS